MSEVEIQTETGAEKREVRSIGGGLIFLAIVLLILPINVLAYYKADVFTFFAGGSFPIMLEMSPLWGVLVLIELIALPVAALFSLVLIALLFMKKRVVPKATIILFAVLAVLSVLDYAANNLLAQYANDTLKESINLRIIKHMSKMLIYSLLFIPYLIFSQRVKETF